MMKKHKHLFKVPAIEVNGWIVAGDQGVCACGAFKKTPPGWKPSPPQ